MERQIDERIIKFLEDAPVFFQPWWLEAVSPGRWDYAVVFRGEEVAAVLPYTYKFRLKKFLLIEMPPITPYLGPWLRKSTAKYANRLGEQKELMTELVEQLPKFSVFNQNFHHSVTNWLPFFWRGFLQTTRYTFLIENKDKIETIWKNFDETIRKSIRKASKTLEICERDEITNFIRLHSLTFKRQNQELPYDKETLKRLYDILKAKNRCKLLFGADSENRPHAAVLYVWDDETVYYLLSGADPQLRNSGATSLLVWEGIKFAINSGRNFDFEGSVVESIEKFIRAFGGAQTPFFTVYYHKSSIISFYRKIVK